MNKRANRSFVKRVAIDIAGFGLMVASLLLSPLPGPGGIPLFLAGLGILALNYDWAENLLKNFEKKRLKLVEKYLVTNKKVSRAIDIACLGIIVAAIFLFVHQDHIIFKILSIASGSISLFVIVSNQKRLDRLFARFQKHKH